MAAYPKFPKSHLVRRDRTNPVELMGAEDGRDNKRGVQRECGQRVDLRDVAGAWAICALVASIALAVSSNFHSPPASALVANGAHEMPPAGSIFGAAQRFAQRTTFLPAELTMTLDTEDRRGRSVLDFPQPQSSRCSPQARSGDHRPLEDTSSDWSQLPAPSPQNNASGALKVEAFAGKRR